MPERVLAAGLPESQLETLMTAAAGHVSRQLYHKKDANTDPLETAEGANVIAKESEKTAV